MPITPILRYYINTMNTQKYLSNIILYATILLLLFAGNVDAQVLIDSVIAVVNEQAITQSELVDEFRITAILEKPFTREPTETEIQAYLDRLISRRLVFQAAKKIGITAVDRNKQVAERMAEIRAKYPSDAAFHQVLQKQELEIEALEKWVYDQIIYDAYYRRQFINRVDSREIDELAPQYFEANKSQFVAPAKVTFRSVLIAVPSDSSEEEKQAAKHLAEKISGRLLQGETYEEIEKSYKAEKSISFSSQTLTTDTSLGAIVAELEPEERKGPISVPKGYRIVELVKKTPARQKEYSEVKDEIAKMIRHSKAESEFKMWLIRKKEREQWYVLEDALKRVSSIKIDSTK